MIHSLSGGVISQYDTYLYCKVKFEENITPAWCWYISPYPHICANQRVLVPFFGREIVGVVERVDKVSAQTAPYPVKRTQEIISILP